MRVALHRKPNTYLKNKLKAKRGREGEVEVGMWLKWWNACLASVRHCVQTKVSVPQRR
jgi:hypothetical protein